MDRFPTTEAGIVALAKRLIHLLKTNPEQLANPPVSAAELEATLDEFLRASKAAVEADAAAAESSAAMVMARDKLPIPIPGQVLALTLAQEDDNRIALTWEPPEDGGPVTSYQVFGRAPDERAWQQLALTRYTEIALDGPDRGIPMEYRVVAFNQVGAGPPSNVVTSLR